MREWLVKLKGSNFDLEELSKRFNSEDIKIEESEDEYFLKSDKFSSYDNANELKNYALELIKYINGIMKIYYRDYQSISLSCISEKKEKGRKHYVWVSDSINVRTKVSTSVVINGERQEINSDNKELDNLIVLANNDELTKKVLRLFVDKRNDWQTLYKIMEVIRDDVGRNIYNWVSKSKFNLFTQTANSAEAIGDEARHGNKKVPAPSNPMKLFEAQNLIRTLVKKWIENKLN